MNPERTDVANEWLSRAILDHRKGRTAAALEWAGKALAHPGGLGLEAAVLTGEILFRGGDLDALDAFLRKRGELQCDPRGRVLWGRLLSRRGDLEAADRVFAEIMADAGAERLYRLCAFERVGMFTRQKRHAEAWQMATEAHRRTTRPYDTDALVAALETSVKWAAAGQLKRLPRARKPLVKTAFILGMPRSGTSLLEQMLDRHPRIRAVGETILMPEMLDGVAGMGGGWPWAALRVSTEVLDHWQSRYRKDVRQDAGALDKEWTLDKTVFPMLQPLIIAMVFPGAKVLRIVRDPRDNASSLYLNNFDPSWGWTGSLESIRRVIQSERRCVDALLEATGVDFVRVQYEALVEDPEVNLRMLLGHLQLPWQAECLAPEKNQRTVMTLSHEQVRKPVNRGSIGRWRDHEAQFGSGWEALAESSGAFSPGSRAT